MNYIFSTGFLTGIVVIAMAAAAGLGQLPAKPAAASDESVRTMLIDLEKQSWEAWKTRDGKFFDGFLSDDHVELGPGGPAGKKAIVDFVGSPVCVVKNYSVDSFKVTIFNDNAALVTYHAAQDTTCGGKPVPSPVWINSLFIKRGSHWLNAAYQQTPENK
jgi:hypothetical protein